MVLVDLGNAAEYLKSDPIYTGKAIAETTDNGYLMNRQVHLNYYAVKGLMARTSSQEGLSECNPLCHGSD